MSALGREADARFWRVAAIKSAESIRRWGDPNRGWPGAGLTFSSRKTSMERRNLRACQLLLGHRKLESTVRYLGIEVDDALEMSEQIDL